MKNIKIINKTLLGSDKYTMQISDGEANGLLISLKNKKSEIRIIFGAVSAFRKLDEGIVLNNLFICDFDFRNAENYILQVSGGDFEGLIMEIAGSEYYEYMKLKHFILFSMNYIVEIITPWKPSIEYM